MGYLRQHIECNNDQSIDQFLHSAFQQLYEINAKIELIYEEVATNYSHQLMEKAIRLHNILEANDFYNIEQKVQRVVNGLGINSIGIDKKLRDISGGERTKVLFAKLLLEKNDLMLLDEPTNFLDVEHIEWLINYLNEFEGAYIVVTHDLGFLSQICERIFELEYSKLNIYNTDFEKFLSCKEVNKKTYLQKYISQQRYIEKQEEFIKKHIVRASSASRAKSRQKKLDKMERLDKPVMLPKPCFHLCALPISRSKGLEIKELSIGYQRALIHDLNLDIMSDEKVVIRGFNGIGKSTLLKTLVGQVQPIKGTYCFTNDVSIGYYEQVSEWADNKNNAIEIIQETFPMLEPKEIRRQLARCSLPEKCILRPVNSLSGGEQAKIKLCKLMLTKANFLLLDEPTNHLDPDSKEVLRQELMKWKGALILISHEKSFYLDWIDREINIEKFLYK
jgi:ATPase subunit of ABC transporter with duplicated ATPase domains